MWIEQCPATEDIRGRFGTTNALDYLICERLFAFVEDAEQDSEFARELPALALLPHSAVAPPSAKRRKT